MSERAQQLRLVEALLFAAAAPLDEAVLARHFDDSAEVGVLLNELSENYAGRGVNLVRLAGGWAFRTAPDLASKLRVERPVTRKLSRAAVETLAVIAYHQPVTRAEIEEVVRKIDKIETAIEPRFQEHFIAAMAIPNKVDAFPNLAKAIDLPAPKEASAESAGRRRRRGAGADPARP